MLVRMTSPTTELVLSPMYRVTEGVELFFVIASVVAVVMIIICSFDKRKGGKS